MEIKKENMYTISKKFSFSASHSLKNLPEGHPCRNMHGHNYVITVELRSINLDEAGFVLDYRKLDLVKSFLDKNFDHQHLNDVVDFNPSAENLARYIFKSLCQSIPLLSAVEVSETDKTLARYEPSFDNIE